MPDIPIVDPITIIDAAWNRRHRACYGDWRLKELYDRPMTLLEVLTRCDGPWASVDDEDRVWVLTRPKAMSRRQAHLWLQCIINRLPKNNAYTSYATDTADADTDTDYDIVACYAADAAAYCVADAVCDYGIVANAARYNERRLQVGDAITILTQKG